MSLKRHPGGRETYGSKFTGTHRISLGPQKPCLLCPGHFSLCIFFLWLFLWTLFSLQLVLLKILKHVVCPRTTKVYELCYFTPPWFKVLGWNVDILLSPSMAKQKHSNLSHPSFEQESISIFVSVVKNIAWTCVLFCTFKIF